MAADLPDAAAWQAAVARVLKGDDLATLVSRGRDGIDVQPLYGPATPIGSGWRRDATSPTIVQLVDDPDPEEAARQAARDLSGGATALNLVFAGAAAARKFGLRLEGIGAVTALEGIEGVSVRCELPRQGGMHLLDHLTAACRRRGARLELAGDPLSTAAFEGEANLSTMARTWLGDVRRLSSDPAVFRCSGRIYHEAGASEAQELAAVLSTGVHYLRALDEAGRADNNGIVFTLVADADHLFTVAKLRALRRLWARVGALCGFEPEPIAIHAETAWRMLARADPWTNLLRNTVACAGAILGGADSVTVLPFTGPLGLADAFARRLARNTPLVLLEEAGLGRVADPLAGSGAIEALTEALCQEAWRLFQDLEREGGIASALQAGTWQTRLAATRLGRAADLASGRLKLVGVTGFEPPTETPAPTVLRPAPPDRPAAQAGSLPSTRDEDLCAAEGDAA